MAGLFGSYITLYCGMFFESRELNESATIGLTAVLVIVNAAYVIYFSSFILVEYKKKIVDGIAKVKAKLCKKKKKKEEEEEGETESVDAKNADAKLAMELKGTAIVKGSSLVKGSSRTGSKPFEVKGDILGKAFGSRTNSSSKNTGTLTMRISEGEPSLAESMSLAAMSPRSMFTNIVSNESGETASPANKNSSGEGDKEVITGYFANGSGTGGRVSSSTSIPFIASFDTSMLSEDDTVLGSHDVGSTDGAEFFVPVACYKCNCIFHSIPQTVVLCPDVKCQVCRAE
jgi:hypothetical protein